MIASAFSERGDVIDLACHLERLLTCIASPSLSFSDGFEQVDRRSNPHMLLGFATHSNGSVSIKKNMWKRETKHTMEPEEMVIDEMEAEEESKVFPDLNYAAFHNTIIEILRGRGLRPTDRMMLQLKIYEPGRPENQPVRTFIVKQVQEYAVQLEFNSRTSSFPSRKTAQLDILIMRTVDKDTDVQVDIAFCYYPDPEFHDRNQSDISDFLLFYDQVRRDNVAFIAKCIEQYVFFTAEHNIKSVNIIRESEAFHLLHDSEGHPAVPSRDYPYSKTTNYGIFSTQKISLFLNYVYTREQYEQWIREFFETWAGKLADVTVEHFHRSSFLPQETRFIDLHKTLEDAYKDVTKYIITLSEDLFRKRYPDIFPVKPDGSPWLQVPRR